MSRALEARRQLSREERLGSLLQDTMDLDVPAEDRLNLLEMRVDGDGSFRLQASKPMFASAGSAGAARLGIGGLDEAESMEREGADRSAIWRKTGWWRGVDDCWRVEIPDMKPKTLAELPVGDFKGELAHPVPLTDLVSNTRLFKAYSELKNIIV